MKKSVRWFQGHATQSINAHMAGWSVTLRMGARGEHKRIGRPKDKTGKFVVGVSQVDGGDKVLW